MILDRCLQKYVKSMARKEVQIHFHFLVCNEKVIKNIKTAVADR